MYSDLLDDKRQELETLRKEKVKGQITRARLQWLNEGEKTTNFFCKLEHKNYVEKTIRKLKLSNGRTLVDQKAILAEIRTFYDTLFKNHDDCLNDYDLKQTFESEFSDMYKVQESSLGDPIRLEELALVLKKMKNGKCPGIDGISVDFLKVFWGKLKFYILNSINSSYEKGVLSVSLRQSIISCLPKGNKDRTILKNWRPIALLCVVYKMASAVIAERMKPHLDKIISGTQTGFLSGQYIGETTRLVYD